MSPSQKSRRAYARAMRVDARLRALNEEARPLLDEIHTTQEKARRAFEAMNLAFAREGLDLGEAFRACQAEDRAAGGD